MNVTHQFRRGLCAIALCVTVSGYAATHAVVSVGAPQPMQALGTITVMPASDDEVIYSETQGKGIVSVGEPITLGPADPQKLVAMR